MNLLDEPFHPDTRALLEYGRAMAAGRTPATIKTADRLADRLFVIDGLGDGRANFLTFGADLVTLFQRDLRRSDLLSLFLPPDQAMLRSFLAAVTAANEPGVVCVMGETACDRRLGLELLTTPLARGVLPGERLLGMLQPLGGESALEGRGLTRLRVSSIFPPRAPLPRKPLRLVVSNP